MTVGNWPLQLRYEKKDGFMLGRRREISPTLTCSVGAIHTDTYAPTHIHKYNNP